MMKYVAIGRSLLQQFLRRNSDDEICRHREIAPTTDDEICRDREIAPTTDDEICRDREIAPTTGCSFHFKFASPIWVIFGLRNESFSHRIFVAIPCDFI